MTILGPFFKFCGTYSNQGNPLMDGALSHPSAYAGAISIGACTNHDQNANHRTNQATFALFGFLVRK